MTPNQQTAIGPYDVVVCGGGPAGIGAAAASARNGARTLLVERLSHVGGVATGAFIYHWMDTPGGPIFDDLVKRLQEVDAAHWYYDPESHRTPGRVQFCTETLKVVALKMLREAGVEILFCSMAESAWMEENRARGVWVANKGGRSRIEAPVVIDCTADGDLAASAGAHFLKGDPDDGRLQHVNFKYHLDGVDWSEFKKHEPAPEECLRLVRDAQNAGTLQAPSGVFRPPAELFPYYRDEGEWTLSKWEIEGVDSSDPLSISNCLVECQLAAFEVVQFCRRQLPGFEKCRISRFPDVLGTRESRRIIGDYVLTGDDVLSARKFEDGIARACFFIDFHDSPPGRTIPYSPEFKKANRPSAGDWYEIPYRSLVPKGIEGMLVAGRCISSEREAQASLRVMPTCLYTGAAAGTAAAIAARKGVLPREAEVGRLVRAALLGPTGSSAET